MPRHKNQVVSIQTLQPSIFRAPHTKTKPNMIQTRKSSGVHPPHRYRVNFDLPRKNLVKFNPLRKNHVTFDQLVWNQLSTLNSSPFWFLDPKTQVNFVPDTEAKPFSIPTQLGQLRSLHWMKQSQVWFHPELGLNFDPAHKCQVSINLPLKLSQFRSPL